MSDSAVYREYNPYYGHFIIGRNKIGQKRYTSHALIKEGIWLTFGDGLTVKHIINHERKKWYLLGDAFQSNPNGKGPLDELRNATLLNIDAISSSWAGRWLLIGYDRIFTDASSLLKCFYKKTASHLSETREYWFASNPVILQEATQQQDISTTVEDKIAIESGWVVPPRSGYKNTRVLLPTQSISICNGTIEARQVLSVSKQACSYKETLDELIQRYSCILKNIACVNDNIWTALTGGIDSRLVTAIAHYSGVKVKTFTFRGPYFYMPSADKKLPTIIAKLAGFQHHWINKKSISSGRKRIFDEFAHLYQKNPGTSYYSFVNGYLDYFQENTVTLSGTCGELGRCYFYKLLPTSPGEEDLFRVVPMTQFNKTAIRELLHWWSDNPVANVDCRERFYWEARLAGWASNAMLQNSFIFQFYKIRQIPILNCMKAFELILDMDENDRVGGKHYKDAIDLIMPQVKNIPYNPPDPFHKRILMRLSKLINNPRQARNMYYRFLKKIC
ncbi:MAG: hypothetical protein FVQ85_10385 [Planctomycetes bacterium]|nr:hypothetical protein [Planctomycetota bacterium]